MTLETAGPILLVGAGKMGGALLEGWLSSGLPADKVGIQDPNPPEECAALIAANSIALNPPHDTLPDGLVVVLAVKPQVMDQILPPLAGLARPGNMFLSVAAGKTIASMQKSLSRDAAIIRSIPNTPASVGRGMTVAVANSHVTKAQIEACSALLGAVGQVAIVEDEALIDAVTAVSGSGPAYVFLLAECMAKAGTEAGLPEDLARQIARATVEGAGELLHRSRLDAATLRRNVTSPGGTTAAALDILGGDKGLEELMVRAIDAATHRSRELSG